MYRAVTAEQAAQELTEFTTKWSKYSAIGRLWRDNWERVIAFFSFPTEVRLNTYTTNAVESLHSSLRKAVKMRGSFPSEKAALKLLYLGVQNTIAKWQTVQFWKEALNYWPSRFCYSMYLGSVAEISEGFLFLLGQRIHVEILHGLHPVFVNLNGQRSHQAQTSGGIRKDADH